MIRHARRATSRLSFLGLYVLAAAACTEEYEFGQPIEMGPWIFEVGGVSLSASPSGRRARTIRIDLELHNYEERHGETFGEFLENCSGGLTNICNPRIGLEDSRGNQFKALDIRPVSGGSLRSRRWTAECLVFYGSHALGDNGRLAGFRVIIRNPDPQRGQPRRVSIRLR